LSAPAAAGLGSAPAAPTIASIRRRLASMLYESMLVVGVSSVSFLLPHVVAGVIWQVSAPGLLTLLHLVLVMGVYFIWFWLRSGQTLAMHTWRIKLVDAHDGSLAAPARAILRYLLAWPSVCFFGAGLVWALFDRDRQFLHDRLAGTRILYLGKPRPV
jgi:uncharacterized RDD family membrane protein YckC